MQKRASALLTLLKCNMKGAPSLSPGQKQKLRELFKKHVGDESASVTLHLRPHSHFFSRCILRERKYTIGQLFFSGSGEKESVSQFCHWMSYVRLERVVSSVPRAPVRMFCNPFLSFRLSEVLGESRRQYKLILNTNQKIVCVDVEHIFF